MVKNAATKNVSRRIALTGDERFAILTMLDNTSAKTLAGQRELAELHTKLRGDWRWKAIRRAGEALQSEADLHTDYDLDGDEQDLLEEAAEQTASRMTNLIMRPVVDVLGRLSIAPPVKPIANGSTVEA